MDKMYKSQKNEKKNKYTVLLECFLLRKVFVDEVYMFHKNNLDLDSSIDKQFYVCINDDEIIKEALNCKKSNTEMNLGRVINTTKPLVFKVGPINEPLTSENKREMIDIKTNNNETSKIYHVLLTNIKVGNFQTNFDMDDPEKEIDKTKFSSSEKDCLFIHRSFNDDFNTDNAVNNKKMNYSFITNNESVIKPECLISFRYDNFNNYKCQKCENQVEDLKYCLNDNIYLCPKCDQLIHNGSKPFNSLKKHKRISNLEYSVIHQNICSLPNHEKPYEIYCNECEELFCIKCLSGDIHNIQHEKKSAIIHINDGLLDKIIIEQNTLNRDMETMKKRIDNKITEYEKYSKDVVKITQEISKEITERQLAATEDISRETLKRTTFLMCTMMELQRLLLEIDSKINFLKSQHSKNDFPNFLNTLKLFDDYIKYDFLKNLKIIMDKNLEGLSTGFYKIEQKKK